jgi:hypothetical protein
MVFDSWEENKRDRAFKEIAKTKCNAIYNNQAKAAITLYTGKIGDRKKCGRLADVFKFFYYSRNMIPRLTKKASFRLILQPGKGLPPG